MSPESAKIVEFQKAFLRNVRRNGRTNEVEMATDFEVRYFFRRFELMNVINTGLLGTKMLKRGKMNFAIGSPVKDKDLVKRIFSKCGVKL